MNQPRVVLCMKWGTLYPGEYVNVLYRACRANISGNFRFVCLTNEAEDLLPEIEVYPVPSIGLDDRHYHHGAWPKIGVFSRDLYGLEGRCLFIDLDSAIVGSLDEMFQFPGHLVAIDFQPWYNRRGHPPLTGTGVFAFDFGSLGSLVDRLRLERDAIIEKYVIEQDFVHDAVTGMHYWPEDWVISFKRHLRRPLIIDRFLQPLNPPETAKIVAFHGQPRPVDVVRPPKGNWDRFPHYGSGPVAWMRDYWSRFGGRVL